MASFSVPHIFLSYARKDGIPSVEKLEKALHAENIITWRDTRGIDISRDFTTEIEHAIDNAKAVVVCLTKTALKTEGWVRREIAYALLKKKPIIVARFDDVPPPIAIINNTWLDFFKSWDDYFPQLLTFLQERLADYSYDAPPLPDDLANDPYRPYLEYLLERTNTYLENTVIKQIDLDIETTHDQVKTPQVANPVTEPPRKKRRRDVFDLVYTHQELPKSTFQPTPDPVPNDFGEMMTYYNQRVLLLGDPGAGKTVTLMAYARDLASNRLLDAHTRLPILSIIPTWDDEIQEPLAEWLADTSAGTLSTEDAYAAIENGYALLCLDGLDELGSWREPPQGRPEDGYDPRLRFIETLEATLEHNTSGALVTCRIVDYAAIGEKIALNGAVTLQPLSESQMQDYLTDLPELWAALQQDPTLKQMVQNPLIMSLFAYAFRGIDDAKRMELANLSDAGELRDAIIDRYFQERYDAEINRRYRMAIAEPMPYEFSELMGALQQIAYRNLLGGYRVEDNVLTFKEIEKVIPYAEPFVEFCDYLSFFTTTDDGQAYRFAHLMLRDSLAFQGALQSLQDRRAKVQQRAVNALGTLGDGRAVEPLFALMENADRRLYNSISAAIRRIANSSYNIDALSFILQHGNFHARLEAVNTLSQFKSDEVIEPLRLALHDREHDVRLQAVKALGKLANPETIPELIKALQDNSISIQRVALNGLVIIGEPALAGLSTIANHPDTNIRRRAITAISEINVPDTIPILLSYLPYSDADTCLYIIQLLDTQGELSNHNQLILEQLKRLINNTNPNIREKIITVLGNIDTPDIIPILIPILSDQADILRIKAINTLYKFHDERVVHHIIKSLKDTNPKVRLAAVRALGELGDQQAFYNLLAAMQDEDMAVRRWAIKSLIKLEDDRTYETLIELAYSKKVAKRRRAITALGELGDKRGIEHIIYALLHDPKKQNRNNASKLIADFAPQEGLEILIPYLQHEESKLRGHAATALGRIGDKQALSYLMENLQDENMQVRVSTIASIMKLDQKQAIDSLVESFIYPSASVRKDSVEVLKRIGNPPLIKEVIVKQLIQYLEHTDPNIREYAAQGLKRLKTPEALEAIAQWEAQQNNTEE